MLTFVSYGDWQGYFRYIAQYHLIIELTLLVQHRLYTYTHIWQDRRLTKEKENQQGDILRIEHFTAK